MAILMICENVVVKKQTIAEKYPGGLTQYREDCPTETYLEDEHLTRIAFMNHRDVDVLLDRLQGLGLTIADEEQSGEVVVVNMFFGMETECDWLEGSSGPGGLRCWLLGTEPGEVMVDDFHKEQYERMLKKHRKD